MPAQIRFGKPPAQILNREYSITYYVLALFSRKDSPTIECYLLRLFVYSTTTSCEWGVSSVNSLLNN